ncbi:MAG: pyruvate dehydrogenase (acetyl-transferring) E1 component subunit alpha [Parachlamydiales bacterium]|nr:pyruvate dehydrogenase (acetyl-transferring) E1 component subunit alpha [Parachlamydiales bacterium]
MSKHVDYHLFSSHREESIQKLGSKTLRNVLRDMLLIRQFEIRAKSAYQQGKVGGFFHSYIGQEAIQTAAVLAMGKNNWYTTTYRCHGLALLLGATPDELMAELYGKITGNAKGRGGSMHFFLDRMLGGFAIVGSHVPVATGAGFSLKYKNMKDQVSICFLGDGAVAQGAFHEALNLASLWDLPCMYVIENNKWGMGTAAEKAISVAPIAEKKAPGYSMDGYTFDGMDFFHCYEGFQALFEQVKKTSRPVLIEVLTERFEGHSISDPGLYRTKEELEEAKKRDPIVALQNILLEKNFIRQEEIDQYQKDVKNIILQSMEFAEKSPWPDPIELEEGVLKEP